MTELVGTVVQLLGKEASVRLETPEGPRTVECFLRGRLFSRNPRDVRNQLAVGDEVTIEMAEPDERCILHEIRERRTLLVRRVPGRKPYLQAIAANVDQLVVVSALKEPPFKTGLIDRYLVIAHDADIAPALCVNKIDLGTPAELAAAREELELYRELGYPLVWTSAKSGEGLDELKVLLRRRRSVLAGHSGVGKSKLAQALAGDVEVELPSRAVDRRGKGRHTTTSATLVPLEGGGELVDTPGIRELSLGHVDRKDLARSFVELRPYLDDCRFTSCSHIPEPGCAVKQAVEEGPIARERYESYRRLYEELG